jgi:hypothetical protein
LVGGIVSPILTLQPQVADLTEYWIVTKKYLVDLGIELVLLLPKFTEIPQGDANASKVISLSQPMDPMRVYYLLRHLVAAVRHEGETHFAELVSCNLPDSKKEAQIHLFCEGLNLRALLGKAPLKMERVVHIESSEV